RYAARRRTHCRCWPGVHAYEMKRSAAIASVCLPFEELVPIQSSDSPTVLYFHVEDRGQLCRLLVPWVQGFVLPSSQLPPKRNSVALSERVLPMVSSTIVRDRSSQTNSDWTASSRRHVCSAFVPRLTRTASSASA